MSATAMASTAARPKFAARLLAGARLARPAPCLPRRTFATPPTRTLPALSSPSSPSHRRRQSVAAAASAPSADAEQAARAYRQRFEIAITGGSGPAPPPNETFDAAKWPPDIRRPLTAAGYPSPTPIQAQTWPIAMSGKDMVGISMTGSGKTVAFLLPAMQKIMTEFPPTTPTSGPSVLILAPTRELALQINEEVMRFGDPSGVRKALLYGGASKMEQARQLNRNPHIVIATPGRLIDMLDSGYTTLQSIKYLVMDEADRMLDMGFGKEINRILSALPQHQTLMFSATWPREVQSLARSYMVDPYLLSVGSLEIAANKAITQRIEFLEPKDKRRRLVKHLEELSGEANKVLIFVSTKAQADMLSEFLHSDGWPVFALHGDKDQRTRQRYLDDFRSGRQLVMIATDVASRGLDVPDITCVINYDLPNSIEDYVHRIGRTARAGRTGLSIAYLGPGDARLATDMVRIMSDAGQQVPEELRALAAESRRGGGGAAYGGGGGGRGYGNRPRYGRQDDFDGGRFGGGSYGRRGGDGGQMGGGRGYGGRGDRDIPRPMFAPTSI